MASSSLVLLLGFLLFPISFHTTVAGEHFVLVHGLGHGAWCWYKITTLLQQASHQVTAIDLTSNGISKVVADNVTSVGDYVRPLTQFLANDVQAPYKVILVGHSLGGSSITYAMELFSNKIKKAIFLAAFMPTNNQTFYPAEIKKAITTPNEQDAIIVNFANGPTSPPTSYSINLTLVKSFFYNQSPYQDVNLAEALLNPTPASLEDVFTLTPTKYGSIRRYYIKTDLDLALSPTFQKNIIEQNPPYKVFFIPQSDHSAFFSKPVKLYNLLLYIAAT